MIGGVLLVAAVSGQIARVLSSLANGDCFLDSQFPHLRVSPSPMMLDKSSRFIDRY